jgi:glutathione S-transferase
MAYTLVIGNKNYSSWSMRAWLILRLANVPFEEVGIELYRPDSRAEVEAMGGETGLVPVLIDDGIPIWDTLAITEHLYEAYPTLWPADRYDRARARSYAGEVHSGLHALREAMPVNTRGRGRIAARTPAVEADIVRVMAIWSRAGRRGSSWLFGEFCAADIMFAPVATRFQTYGVKVDGPCASYMAALLDHPLMREWLALGAAEAGIIDQFELPETP